MPPWAGCLPDSPDGLSGEPSCGELGFGKLIQIGVTQVIVGDLVREHVIGSHQDLVSDAYGSALVASSSFETIELLPQIRSLSRCRRVGRLHQRRLQVDVARGGTATAALT